MILILDSTPEDEDDAMDAIEATRTRINIRVFKPDRVPKRSYRTRWILAAEHPLEGTSNPDISRFRQLNH